MVVVRERGVGKSCPVDGGDDDDGRRADHKGLGVDGGAKGVQRWRILPVEKKMTCSRIVIHASD